MFVRVIAAVSLMLGCVVFAGGCAAKGKTAGAVSAHAPDLLCIDADASTVSRAVMHLRKRMGNEITVAPGKSSDPTFASESRFWDEGESKIRVYTQSRTRFADKQGKTIALNMTREKGRPVFVAIDYDGEGGPIRVANELVAALKDEGVNAVAK